jgi:hypothetical protein
MSSLPERGYLASCLAALSRRRGYFDDRRYFANHEFLNALVSQQRAASSPLPEIRPAARRRPRSPGVRVAVLDARLYVRICRIDEPF